MDKDYLQFILAYDFGERVSNELGLACDEFFELAGVIADRYKQSRKEAGKDEYYESFQYFVGNISFADVWKDLVEQKRENAMDTLGDFLEAFNFSYKVYQNDNPEEQAIRQRLVEDGDLDEADINKPLIGLVDDQGANWGDIESDRFLLNKGLAVAIIERMDIYVEDQVVKEFEEALERRDLDPTKYDLNEMVLLCKGLGVGDGEVDYKIAELIVNPERIFVPELYDPSLRDKGRREPLGASPFDMDEEYQDPRPHFSFVIKTENIKPALQALLGSNYFEVPEPERARLLALSSEDILEENQSMLDDIFLSNGYEIDFDKEGNVSKLYLISDVQRNDFRFFEVFAAHVEKGCALSLRGESGELSGLLFDGTHCLFTGNRSPAVEHNGWLIFEKDGAYTVGGGGAYCFEDCSLECLPTSVDELDMVEFCRSKNLNVAYLDVYGSGNYVPFEKYRDHLAKLEALETGSDNEFIVPVAMFESLEQAKQFLDWVDKREHSTMREAGKEFVVKNVDFPAHNEEDLARDIKSGSADVVCRISLEKPPSAEYEKIGKEKDGRYYEPDCFFIEATVGRDTQSESWQTSNWFLFYVDVDGNNLLLDDTLELPDAWKYIQSECEKRLGSDSPGKKESLDAVIAAASRVAGEQQKTERISRKDIDR